MARIAGVNIPENKHVEISLTHIFGIGRKTAQKICVDLKIDYTKKISDLSENEIENIRNSISSYFSYLLLPCLTSHWLFRAFSCPCIVLCILSSGRQFSSMPNSSITS